MCEWRVIIIDIREYDLNLEFIVRYSDVLLYLKHYFCAESKK